MLESQLFTQRLYYHAAVAILKTKSFPNQILVVQRATRSGDPWSGDAAFPGGKSDPLDRSLEATAKRELMEETSISLNMDASYKLNRKITRVHHALKPMFITPFVFEVETPITTHLNSELSNAQWIPIQTLRTQQFKSSYRWRTPYGSINVPCYRFNGIVIWGLTYSIIQNFLQVESRRTIKSIRSQ
ncbi:NUDIX hydrolase [Oleiphilus messinensis]|uniref:NUDIX hydrolase n=1 Tax=Oleiphilus messinensis TaxID=141451 RepID=A0A1Y0I6Y3_9GAMM|nr:CoA pyrophosphatase [Oleiphilus messinensis]ARU56262.1 NUDIX hydrolase [Oleiphilus messinensis]